MTVPGTTVSNQWTDGEDLNATILHNRIDLPLIAAGGQAFYRSRTTTLAVTGSTTAVAAWQNLIYSAGNFGTYAAAGGTAGQFTFAVAGLYRWTVSVAWPNTTAYKGRVLLLINGAISVYGDNISDLPIATAGATPNYVHCGEMPVAVGDVWQIGIASSTNVTCTPQSWSLVKIA